jgi:hypothetical protein
MTMATSNPTKDPRNEMADEAAIEDLPETQDSTALTPDEEKNVVGGSTPLSGGLTAASLPSTNSKAVASKGISGN